jgi:ABC-type Fe3+ transport system permease subunit
MVATPLANLVVKAGLVVESTGSAYTRSWSLAQFVFVVATTPSRYAEEFGWTFLLAGLGASLATVAGAALAWSARRAGRTAWPAAAVVAIALAVPGPLVSIFLIWLLNRRGAPLLVYLYDQTLLAPALAVSWRALPIAILMMWHAFRTIPGEVLESAAIDGAGPLARFFWIAAPMRRAALAAAWLAAFAIAAADLSTSYLVMPPGVSTVPARTFGLLHSGVFDQVAGLCLITGLLAVVFTAGIAWLYTRSGHDA